MKRINVMLTDFSSTATPTYTNKNFKTTQPPVSMAPCSEFVDKFLDLLWDRTERITETKRDGFRP